VKRRGREWLQARAQRVRQPEPQERRPVRQQELQEQQLVRQVRQAWRRVSLQAQSEELSLLQEERWQVRERGNC